MSRRRAGRIPGDRAAGRVAAHGARAGLAALTAVADALPPRLRFGHWNTLMRVLSVGAVLPSIERQDRAAERQDRAAGRPVTSAAAPAPDMRCAIVAGDLDNGGVEAVIAGLARGLPHHGIAVEVLCTSAGRVAGELRAAGVDVRAVPAAELATHLAASAPDAIQLHRVDPALVRALRDAPDDLASRTVPVFHAMESYLDADAWAALGELLARAPLSVAVSASVRDFFAERVALPAPRVVVNGAPPPSARMHRGDARARLSAAIGTELAERDVLVLGLQRFSEQKNAAGLVDAFLLAAERLPGARLIVAGAPDSWLEFRRADALRRLHPHGDRVHLLGDSDPATLLSAADVYALDSFAEGGPLAAVEAAAFGLPVVLSDVGFARELVADGAAGAVVPRANEDWSAAAVSRQRRRRHQRNRTAFAEALVAVAGRIGRAPQPGPPPARFTVDGMVAAHARALREVARSAVAA
jgi:glycosyltransferase involved in cell wall biosynthesis